MRKKPYIHRVLGVLLAAVLVLGLPVPVKAATVITTHTPLGVSTSDDFIIEDGGSLWVQAGVVVSGTVIVKEGGDLQNDHQITGKVTVAGGVFFNYATVANILVTDGSYFNQSPGDTGTAEITGGHMRNESLCGTVTVRGGSFHNGTPGTINGDVVVRDNGDGTPLVLNGTLNGDIRMRPDYVELEGTNAALNGSLEVSPYCRLFMNTPLTVNGAVNIQGLLLVNEPLYIQSGSITFGSAGYLELRKQLRLGNGVIYRHDIHSEFMAGAYFPDLVYDGPAGGYAILELADGTFYLGADGILVPDGQNQISSRSGGSSGSSGTTAPAPGKRQIGIEQLGDYRFRVDLPRLGFLSASVDSEPLEEGADYTLREGSTVLTLTDDFARGLKTGDHILRMEFVSAVAKTDFAVETRGSTTGTTGGTTYQPNANVNPGTGRQ